MHLTHDPTGRSFGEQQINLLEAKPRPGFVAGEVFDRLGKWNEFRGQDAAAPAGNAFIGHLHYIRARR